MLEDIGTAAEIDAAPLIVPSEDELGSELVDEMRELEGNVLTGYTLADAIREGSTMSDQLTGGWIDAGGRACAMGAAYLAAQKRGWL